MLMIRPSLAVLKQNFGAIGVSPGKTAMLAWGTEVAHVPVDALWLLGVLARSGLG
jgi:hypothetical protein